MGRKRNYSESYKREAVAKAEASVSQMAFPARGAAGGQA